MNFYWLIELRPAFEGHPAFNPTYYAGWQVSPVEAAKTYDVHASPKFTRKKDAETVADALGACHTLSCVWKAVEHGFDTSAVETKTEPCDTCGSADCEGCLRGLVLNRRESL
jgi:hypothetical protein